MAANSGESIEAIVELIDSQQLSDALTVSWFNNLANAKHPTKEAVVKASVNLFKYFSHFICVLFLKIKVRS